MTTATTHEEHKPLPAEEIVGNLRTILAAGQGGYLFGDESRALEQAIAILSVLEHPDFWRIVREYTGKGFIFGVATKYAHEFADMSWADTPIAALLKAHEALKPQEGATSRKEPDHDA